MGLKFLLVGAVGLLGVGSVFAAGPSDPIRIRLNFGGSPAEIELQAGEPARLRNHTTGEVLNVRVMPEAGAVPKARVEISRSQDRGELAGPSEQFEVGLGELAKSNRLGSQVELQLLSLPAVWATAAAGAESERFQITLDLPDGRTVMAVGDVKPDELVRVTDRRTGLNLGFRPALVKAGPSNVEIFSITKKATGDESYGFVARVPVGGEFSLGAESLALPAASIDPAEKIKGSVMHPMAGMFDETARAGNASQGPIAVRARWDGGPWLDGVTNAGEMFRLEVPGVAGQIGISAVAEEKPGTYNVSVFQVRKVRGAGEALKHLGSMQVRESEPAALADALSGHLEIQVMPRGLRPKPLKSCWLGCGGGVSAHGCSVSCSDTDCCVGLCCKF
jgi:hypothetical protein